MKRFSAGRTVCPGGVGRHAADCRPRRRPRAPPWPTIRLAWHHRNQNSQPQNPTPAKNSTPPSRDQTGFAGQTGRAQSPSIAGDLLDERPPSDLDNQLLDGLPPARQSAGQTIARKTPAVSPPLQRPMAIAPPVVEGPVLGAGADPLSRIGEQMRVIERRLEAHRQADTDTPALQDQIVDELAQLIERLEQQQNSQQSLRQSKTPSLGFADRAKIGSPTGRRRGQPRPPADNRPAKESTERLGKAEAHAANADEIRGLMKDVWGQLPAREREQMLQSPPEQFLPKYELLLEKYYKRLADEQQASAIMPRCTAARAVGEFFCGARSCHAAGRLNTQRTAMIFRFS